MINVLYLVARWMHWNVWSTTELQKIRISDLTHEVQQLRTQLAAAEARIRDDYNQASYLRSLCSPECQSLDDTSGVLSQLSNYIAGLTQKLATAEARQREDTP